MNEEEEVFAGYLETDISPFQGLVVELHEVYNELLDNDFPENFVAKVIGSMLFEAMAARGLEDDDEDDDDDDDLDDEDEDNYE